MRVSEKIKLGKKQVLKVVKTVDFGVYLSAADEDEKILLPKAETPPGLMTGDEIDVFVYKDSEDRPIATTREPYLELGSLAVLRVADVGKYGAFLDWGLMKDLFLPFRQQTGKVRAGDKVLVSLYVDKSERLCATMRVYQLLSTDSPYKKGDRVSGIVYDKSANFGVFVAVDEKYSALIPKKEVTRDYDMGQVVSARVSQVKPDGKLDLSVSLSVPEQMNIDAAALMEKIQKNGGAIALNDHSDANLIREELHMSKSAFKRAAGRLLKEGKVRMDDHGIRLS